MAIEKKLDSLESTIHQGQYQSLPEFNRLRKQYDKADTVLLSEFIFYRSNKDTELQSLFVENSRITHFTLAGMEVDGETSPVFDASINLNFFVLPKYWPIGLIIVPRFNLRMFLNQNSAPIRTPSNMIGATLFKNLSPGFEEDSYYQFISGSFFHHSNGQDSGSYNVDGSINTKTGNFGVNFLELAYMIGRVNLKPKKYSTNMYLSVRYQQDFIIGPTNPETNEKELENEYGRHRLNIEASFAKYTSRDSSKKSYSDSKFNYHRFIVDGALVYVPSRNVRLNMEAKYYYKIPWSPNFLLTAQAGWLGHDCYNIYFNEQTGFVRIGIAVALMAGSGTRPSDVSKKYIK